MRISRKAFSAGVIGGIVLLASAAIAVAVFGRAGVKPAVVFGLAGAVSLVRGLWKFGTSTAYIPAGLTVEQSALLKAQHRKRKVRTTAIVAAPFLLYGAATLVYGSREAHFLGEHYAAIGAVVSKAVPVEQALVRSASDVLLATACHGVPPPDLLFFSEAGRAGHQDWPYFTSSLWGNSYRGHHTLSGASIGSFRPSSLGAAGSYLASAPTGWGARLENIEQSQLDVTTPKLVAISVLRSIEFPGTDASGAGRFVVRTRIVDAATFQPRCEGSHTIIARSERRSGYVSPEEARRSLISQLPTRLLVDACGQSQTPVCDSARRGYGL